MKSGSDWSQHPVIKKKTCTNIKKGLNFNTKRKLLYEDELKKQPSLKMLPSATDEGLVLPL